MIDLQAAPISQIAPSAARKEAHLAMNLHSARVRDVLRGRGVTSVYHANTVLTSCHFIHAAALLSRGLVENRGLAQTPQWSDALDKDYGIWFDVFADSVDIHARARTWNHYGPVLFVLDADVLLAEPSVSVTRRNPSAWRGLGQDERWFKSTDDLEANFQRGDFNQMLVLRESEGALRFRDFLTSIVLDDPQLTDSTGRNLYDLASGALAAAIEVSRLNLTVERRVCDERCECRLRYRENLPISFSRFLPAN